MISENVPEKENKNTRSVTFFPILEKKKFNVIPNKRFTMMLSKLFGKYDNKS